MIPAILGVGVLAGAVVGAVAGVLVTWEATEYLIRHSRYRNHANGHLWSHLR